MTVTVAPGAFAPPTIVEPQVTEPAKYGLFSASTVLDDTQDPKVLNGVRWKPHRCDPARVFIALCDPGEDPPPSFDTDPGGTIGEASPFAVYGWDDCNPVGNIDEASDRAVQHLIDGEQRAVETQFWTGEGGTLGHLSDSGNEHLTPGGGPSSVLAGIAALEGWLGSNYGGVGVIHVPRAAVPVLEFLQQIETSGDRMFTKLGTRIAAGGGYAVNTGPDGDPADDGTVWAYATGPVRIWRSGIIRPAPVGQLLDRTANSLLVTAQRIYVAAFDCGTADVNMTVDGCGC